MKKVSHSTKYVPGLRLLGLERLQFCLIQKGAQGFSRLELFAVLAVLTLLAALAVPALANTRLRSQRAVCFNNLSRIGQAAAMWSTDRGGAYPWLVLYAEGTGGTRNHPTGLGANIWFQFLAMSNELVTPKYLVCPSDTTRRMATDFSIFPFGGFLHANYRNAAVSYVLGHPLLQEGRGVLSGDRNLQEGFFSVSCSYFAGLVLNFQTPSSASWGTDIHVNTGNLLFNDGSVEQTDPAALRAALMGANFDNGGIHFLSP